MNILQTFSNKIHLEKISQKDTIFVKNTRLLHVFTKSCYFCEKHRDGLNAQEC